MDRAETNSLSNLQRRVLRAALFVGTGLSRLRYPEAAEVVTHYLVGDGTTLELSSSYFERSDYLLQKISKLGVGSHGPLTLRQEEDWRL